MPDNYTGGSFLDPSGNVEPLQPAPDTFEPINFPYRGTEQHGVAPQERPWIPHDPTIDDWTEGDDGPVEYAEIEPIPVILYQTGPREIKSWRAFQGYAGSSSSILVGQNGNRRRTRIRSLAETDGPTVYIGHTSNTSSLEGYPIDPGQSVEIDTEEEVYSVSDGIGVNVAVIVELVVVP